MASSNPTLEKFAENAALLLRFGLPSTLIRHENEAFRKRSSKLRNLKTPGLWFSVDGQHSENGAFGKRVGHENRVISLPEFSSTAYKRHADSITYYMKHFTSVLWTLRMFLFLSLELERQYREETRRIEEQRWVEIVKVCFVQFGPPNLTLVVTNVIKKSLERWLTNSRDVIVFSASWPSASFSALVDIKVISNFMDYVHQFNIFVCVFFFPENALKLNSEKLLTN